MSRTGSYIDDIAEFHQKFGIEYRGRARVLPPELAKFRIKFLKEELREYVKTADAAAKAIKQQRPTSFDDEVAYNLEHMLDALVDLVYVALGTAHLHGFDFDEAWRRVHEANMKKQRAERRADSKRKSKFDVVKPPGWRPPRMQDLVINHAHR